MRFPLPVVICLTVALAGCATPQQKLARQQKKLERKAAEDDSRTTEQRRMLAVQNGDVNSSRGAEIYMPDKNRSFDPNHATAAAAHSYGSGKAPTKTFNSDHQLRLDEYQTRNFYDSKKNSATDRKYATAEANTKGKFLNLFAHKKADTKTAATKQAWDANKSAPARSLADGHRPYAGPESKKINQAVDAKTLANWRTGGESVIYTDGTVERVSTVKQLSIDDIRDLLNKSK